MNHPLTHPVHRFHIPVMGTGFTIDTPLKVARYGISSVVSLVDDILIEQMRCWLSGVTGRPFAEITPDAEDSRADRITSYLNLLDDLVTKQMEKLRSSLFEKGSEITRYFEMLPESPLKALYYKMLSTSDPQEKSELQDELRRRAVPGAIDVNIMTKVDRPRMRKGDLLPPIFSDALSALRGYAHSRLRSSIILSAGINQRLYGYLAEFNDFFPDELGEIKKGIILKVNDFRSALVQGKFLARKGLWVSEYRVESGLNCGGHAFGGKGTLLGPVLEDFQREKTKLAEQLQAIWQKALARLGRTALSEPLPIRVTVQGGIGTADEDNLLHEHYEVDGTGWASPFLLVPEVVNLDESHVHKLCEAGEDDVELSEASPLGVPFWSLRTSTSEERRVSRIAHGKPGSACPKGFLLSNTEFTEAPLCTASAAYQRRKLQALAEADLRDVERLDLHDQVVAKACICNDLAGSVTVPNRIDPSAPTAVCCGPNIVYFSRIARLKEMIDHIYGRASLPLTTGRPHMFLSELSLHIDRLKSEVQRRKQGLAVATSQFSPESKENLLRGIRHYRDLTAQLISGQRDEFLARLESLRADLERLLQ